MNRHGGWPQQYFRDGYLVVDGCVGRDWLERLRTATDGFIEDSWACRHSSSMFDLVPGHTAGSPPLRRLTAPVNHHATYSELASQSPIVDLAEDLLGPNVVFHHSKLNVNLSAVAKR